MTIQTEADGRGAVELSVTTPVRFQPARMVLPVLLAIAAVTLLSFRGYGPVTPGIDPSWHVGLPLAVAEPLAFGREIVLT